MVFKFGQRSSLNLTGVHPTLQRAAEFAIEHTKVDFGVYEGLRSIEKERENIRNGSSRLSNPRDCMHCMQPDGYGHAVDLVPYINDSYQWDWEGCYEIAHWIQQYSFIHNLTIRWGGVWDIPLNKLSINLEREVSAYQERHIGKDFLDGVHFELPRQVNTINDGTDEAKIA